ncbi:hypothetical protein GCM10011341_06500 [Frigidibacter albus]|nr:hypothetical protein GCM10011341_06500 [Frigidibacter albus]
MAAAMRADGVTGSDPGRKAPAAPAVFRGKALSLERRKNFWNAWALLPIRGPEDQWQTQLIATAGAAASDIPDR